LNELLNLADIHLPPQRGDIADWVIHGDAGKRPPGYRNRDRRYRGGSGGFRVWSDGAAGGCAGRGDPKFGGDHGARLKMGSGA